MQLTDEQRAELERRQWVLEKEVPGEFQQLAKDPEGYAAVIRLYAEGKPYIAGPAQHVVEASAILGIAPPGYRLVPEEVAEVLGDEVRTIAAVRSEFYDASIGSGPGTLANWDKRAKAWSALASALSPKEVEPRG